MFSLLLFFSFSFSFEEKIIHIKSQSILVQVAKTPSERAQGLMHRKSWGKYQGMLFIFDQQEPLSFWMKNTFLPLSIAFFNQERYLVDIQDMLPHKGNGDPPTYKSQKPAKYALEVPQGWFSQNGIGLGSRLRLD